MSYRFYGSGDANQDGVVDIGDAAYIASAVVGLPGFTLNEYMDINRDGAADIGDAAYIASAVVGLPGFNIPAPLPPSSTDPVDAASVFSLHNLTGTTGSLVFNKAALPGSVSNLGAFELEVYGADLQGVTVPSQFQGGFYLNSSNRIAFAAAEGIPLDGLPNTVAFGISYANGTPSLATDKTRLWDGSSAAAEIAVN